MQTKTFRPDSFSAIRELTKLSGEVIDRVVDRYMEPERHYHGVCHIQRMFRTAAATHFTPSQAQALAILYHDAVYIPGSNDGENERLSALLLRQHAHGLVGREIVEQAVSMIHDTITHTATTDASKLVLDLDLAGLAGTWQQFVADGEVIYREVAHLVSDRFEYDRRRADFFEKMCKRPRIYMLPEFAPLEAIARKNMRLMIESVKIQNN